MARRALFAACLALGALPALAQPQAPPPRPPPPQAPAQSFQCAGKQYCREMRSCEEAYFYFLRCGVRRLDGDGDGVPCESLCGGGRRRR